ncbi:zinc finger MYM-type protein 1-like [Aphis craccivora]|uniref:Zinc finger MYM-type protein 1-like n=1 Tax=Aphis craccivora TaxID=307492 RepID=A0A6G0VZ33_APHCR|nr:zinc finger MYM-type protein 1-like [Aphis craccivora]
MATLMTAGGAGCEWAKMLPEVQRLLNNSETKVTGKTPLEKLHGYRPRFEQGVLLALSATKDDWSPPKELHAQVRENMELENTRRKTAYDIHRHDNKHNTVGEIVVIRPAPNCTGESTKMQDKYREPLVVTVVLSSDVNRVTELNTTKGSRFATTAHVSQLKSWKLPADDKVEGDQGEPETELPSDHEEERELGDLRSELTNDEGLLPPDSRLPAAPGASIPDDRRSQRVVHKPAWMRDYTW